MHLGKIPVFLMHSCHLTVNILKENMVKRVSGYGRIDKRVPLGHGTVKSCLDSMRNSCC